MTTPSEQPRFNPQQYGYGNPPPEQQGRSGLPPQRPQQGPPPQWQPGPGHTGPQQMPPQPPQPPAGPPSRPGPEQSQGYPVVRKKGFFGALLDTRFDAMVTPMIIRFFYLLALAVITLLSLFLFAGIWGLQGKTGDDGGFDWPFYLALVVAPLFWLFNVLLVRMALEFVINQFKITEELQKIRRNTSG